MSRTSQWKKCGAVPPVSAAIFLREGVAWFDGDVEEGDSCVLSRKSFGEGGADAAAAAGDENGFTGEIGIGGACGGVGDFSAAVMLHCLIWAWAARRLL